MPAQEIKILETKFSERFLSSMTFVTEFRKPRNFLEDFMQEFSFRTFCGMSKAEFVWQVSNRKVCETIQSF